jgi:hypothetical protein
MPSHDSSPFESSSHAQHDSSEASKREQRDLKKSWISIESVASSKDRLQVGLDHKWLKDGVFCSPDEPGAHKLGFSSAGYLMPGQTNILEVSPGSHEIMVSSDFYASEHLDIEVSPGEKQKLICGNNFRGAQKVFYSIYYLFNREIPGKFYYFLRQLN